MKIPKYNSNDELPITLTAKDIAGYLNISLTCAYEVMHSENFPSIQVGKRLIVARDRFLNWIETTTGQIL